MTGPAEPSRSPLAPSPAPPSPPARPLVVGLTGGIGMGKSTVADMFRRAGVPVHDADASVHALYAKGGAAVEPVGEAFAGTVREGAVDRAALSEAVIGSPERMARLEAIVHPLVRAEEERFLADARERGDPFVVLDIPLLFETEADARVDTIVVVSAPEAVRRARVLARPGMSAGKLDAIVARQVPDRDKRERAHHIIDTGVGLEETERAVRGLVDRLGPRGAEPEGTGRTETQP